MEDNEVLRDPHGDPHGIVDVFARHLNANLDIMDPDAAARQAMAAVDGYLRGSKFIDVSTKTTSGKQYIRVDRRPEEMARDVAGRR